MWDRQALKQGGERSILSVSLTSSDLLKSDGCRAAGKNRSKQKHWLRLTVLLLMPFLLWQCMARAHTYRHWSCLRLQSAWFYVSDVSESVNSTELLVGSWTHGATRWCRVETMRTRYLLWYLFWVQDIWISLAALKTWFKEVTLFLIIPFFNLRDWSVLCRFLCVSGVLMFPLFCISILRLHLTEPVALNAMDAAYHAEGFEKYRTDRFGNSIVSI